MLALARRLRTAAGPAYPLGAIIPSPRGMDLNPTYWPGFPYEQLAQSYDVFLPMGYFTYRFKTAAASRDYTQRTSSSCASGPATRRSPCTPSAGSRPRRASPQVRAFAQTALEAGATGASLYDYATTKPAQWRALASVFSTS